MWGQEDVGRCINRVSGSQGMRNIEKEPDQSSSHTQWWAEKQDGRIPGAPWKTHSRTIKQDHKQDRPHQCGTPHRLLGTGIIPLAVLTSLELVFIFPCSGSLRVCSPFYLRWVFGFHFIAKHRGRDPELSKNAFCVD